MKNIEEHKINYV